MNEAPVDSARLLAFLDAHGIGAGPLSEPIPLHGGTQNIMLRFTRGDRSLVFRRGPRVLRTTSNDILRREIRVLSALADTDVPCPRIVAAAGDDEAADFDGAVFYVMDAVDGFNPLVEVPAPYDVDAALRRSVCLSTARALAALGEVDHAAVGLADFGRPAGFLARQVSRWRGQLDTYASLDGYPGHDFDEYEPLSEWLEEHRPAQSRPGLIHGDYHLANVMATSTDGGIAAIVDWEMSTIGDPLLDLGALLVTWPRGDEHEVVDAAISRYDGFPSTAEIFDEYRRCSSRDVSAADWYVAMAGFKLGVVLEGTYARACAGHADREIGDTLHRSAHVLMDRARRAAGL